MSATLPQSRSDARSFHLRVFGCQMNFYDGELMRASLLGRGYQESADPDQADVVLFHTCSVREGAEERVHGLLGELRRAKRELSAQYGRNPTDVELAAKMGVSLKKLQQVDITSGVKTV